MQNQCNPAVAGSLLSHMMMTWRPAVAGAHDTLTQAPAANGGAARVRSSPKASHRMTLTAHLDREDRVKKGSAPADAARGRRPAPRRDCPARARAPLRPRAARR